MDHANVTATMQSIRCSFMPATCRRQLIAADRRGRRFHGRISRHLKPQAIAVSRSSLLARRYGRISTMPAGRKLNERGMALGAGPAGSAEQLTNWLLWHAKFALMGQPPHVLPWHPAWPDFQTVFREIEAFLHRSESASLLLSNEPTAFSVALADSGERVHRLRCRPF